MPELPEIRNLAGQIDRALKGADYERDLYNRLGRWSRRLVAYRKGEECPVCGSVIEEIRTGSTSGCICPQCQKL